MLLHVIVYSPPNPHTRLFAAAHTAVFSYVPRACLSVMLAECAICLSQGEASEGTMNGGVLTPSVAMGRALVRRLEKTGRFKFERTRLQMPVSPAHPIQSSL